MIQAAWMLPLLRDAWPCYQQWTSCQDNAIFSMCIGKISPKRAWAKVCEFTRVRRVHGFWRHLVILFSLYLSLRWFCGSLPQRRVNTEGRYSKGHEPMQRSAESGPCWSATLSAWGEAAMWDITSNLNCSVILWAYDSIMCITQPWGCTERPFWQCHTNTSKHTYVQTFWGKRKFVRKSAILQRYKLTQQKAFFVANLHTADKTVLLFFPFCVLFFPPLNCIFHLLLDL